MEKSDLVIVLALCTLVLFAIWGWGSRRRALNSMKKGDRTNATDLVGKTPESEERRSD